MFRDLLHIAYGLAAWSTVIALVFFLPTMDPFLRLALQYAVLNAFVLVPALFMSVR